MIIIMMIMILIIIIILFKEFQYELINYKKQNIFYIQNLTNVLNIYNYNYNFNFI